METIRAKSWKEVPSMPGIFIAWLTALTHQGHLARKTIQCGKCGTTFIDTSMDNKGYAKCPACNTVNRS